MVLGRTAVTRLGAARLVPGIGLALGSRGGAKGLHLALGVFVDEARVAGEVLGRRRRGGERHVGVGVLTSRHFGV